MEKSLEYEIIAKIRLDSESFKKIDEKLDTLSKPRKVKLDLSEANAGVDALLAKLNSVGGGGIGRGAGLGIAAAGYGLGKVSRATVDTDVGMTTTSAAAAMMSPTAMGGSTGFAYTASGAPCHNCGNLNPPGAKYCRVCGQNTAGSLFHRTAVATGKAVSMAGNALVGIGNAGIGAATLGANLVDAVVGGAAQAGGAIIPAVGRAVGLMERRQRPIGLEDIYGQLRSMQNSQGYPIHTIQLSGTGIGRGPGPGPSGGGGIAETLSGASSSVYGIYNSGGSPTGMGGLIAPLWSNAGPAARPTSPGIGAYSGPGNWGNALQGTMIQGGVGPQSWRGYRVDSLRAAMGNIQSIAADPMHDLYGLGVNTLNALNSGGVAPAGIGRLIGSRRGNLSMSAIEAERATESLDTALGMVSSGTPVGEQIEAELMASRRNKGRTLSTRGGRGGYSRSRRPGSAGYLFSDIVEGAEQLTLKLGEKALFDNTPMSFGRISGGVAAVIATGAGINATAERGNRYDNSLSLSRVQGQHFIGTAQDMYDRSGGSFGIRGVADGSASSFAGLITQIPGIAGAGESVLTGLGYGKSTGAILDDAKRITAEADYRKAVALQRKDVVNGLGIGNLNMAGQTSALGIQASIIGQTDPARQALNNVRVQQDALETAYKVDSQSRSNDRTKVLSMLDFTGKFGDAARFAVNAGYDSLDSAANSNFSKQYKLIGAQGITDYNRIIAANSNMIDSLRISAKATTASVFNFGVVGANLELDSQINAIDGVGGTRELALAGAKGDSVRINQINSQYDSQVNSLKVQQSGNTHRAQRSYEVQNMFTQAIRMDTAGDVQGAALYKLRASANADMAANSEPAAVIARGAQYGAERGAMMKEIGRSNFLYNEGTASINAASRIAGLQGTRQEASAQIASIQEDTERAIRGVNPDQPGSAERIAAIRQLGKSRLQSVDLMTAGGGLTAENIGAYESHGNVSPFGAPEDVRANLKKARDAIDSATNKDFAAAGMGGGGSGEDWAAIKGFLKQIADNTGKAFGATN